MFKIILLVLIIVNISEQAKKPKENICDRKSVNQMDVALMQLLGIGEKAVKFPENPKQLRTYCNQAKRFFDRASKYVNTCLNKFGRDSAKIILHTVEVEMKSVCKSGRLNKKALSLLEAAPCGNQGNSRFYKNCYMKLIDKFMGAVNVEASRKIPISCCTFFDFVHCMEGEAEQVPKCTPKVRDFILKYSNKMFEGITTLLCNVYDDSNTECDTIVAEAPGRNSTQKLLKSALLPLINIAMSLGDQELLKRSN